MFFSTNISFAQLSSELTSFFDDEMDTLLQQLYRKEFLSLNILVKPSADGMYPWTSSDYENNTCKYINDSIIKIESQSVYQDSLNSYTWHYNFKSRRLVSTDTVKYNPPRSETRKSIIIDLQKDSLEYSIRTYYSIYCNLNDTSICNDTVSRAFERKRFDSQKRLISKTYYFAYGSYKSGFRNVNHFDIEMSYPDSATTIEKRYNHEDGKRFLYCLTTVNMIYKPQSKEIIEKTVWYPDHKRRYQSSEIKYKTINYSSNSTIKSADYRVEVLIQGKSRKQKSGMEMFVTLNGH